jgi:hypothetical protein
VDATRSATVWFCTGGVTVALIWVQVPTSVHVSPPSIEFCHVIVSVGSVPVIVPTSRTSASWSVPNRPQNGSLATGVVFAIVLAPGAT